MIHHITVLQVVLLASLSTRTFSKIWFMHFTDMCRALFCLASSTSISSLVKGRVIIGSDVTNDTFKFFHGHVMDDVGLNIFLCSSELIISESDILAQIWVSWLIIVYSLYFRSFRNSGFFIRNWPLLFLLPFYCIHNNEFLISHLFSSLCPSPLPLTICLLAR